MSCSHDLFHDTIVALATATGSGRNGIVRLSGDRALEITEELCPTLLTPGQADTPRVHTGFLQLVAWNARLPVEAYVWPTRKSYTREPVVELHTINSPPLLQAIIEACQTCGARLARPGEFTLRAFLAGRLDLTQAEAVLATIDARQQRDLEVALEQLAGGLAHPLQALRNELLELLAHLEAELDFAEEDLQFMCRETMRQKLKHMQDQVILLRERLQQRATSEQPACIVLWGMPNAGKSSLFNALVGDSQAALTHDQPGTTRDFLTARLHLDGRACQLVDTAGIDFTASPGSLDDVIGHMSTRIRDRAHLSVLCVDGHRSPTPKVQNWIDVAVRQEQVVVVTKCDLVPVWTPPPAALRCSALTGEGIPQVREHLLSRVDSEASGEVLRLTTVRCRNAVQDVAEAMQNALLLVSQQTGTEYLAAELRRALDGLGQVLGTVTTEDVLDQIFSRFCIGK